MRRTECTTLLSSNWINQLHQLQNAFRILAKPEHRMREQAILLRQRVSSEWAIQATQEEWFRGRQRLHRPACGK
jgi:hypothetical protein